MSKVPLLGAFALLCLASTARADGAFGFNLKIGCGIQFGLAVRLPNCCGPSCGAPGGYPGCYAPPCGFGFNIGFPHCYGPNCPGGNPYSADCCYVPPDPCCYAWFPPTCAFPGPEYFRGPPLYYANSYCYSPPVPVPTLPATVPSAQPTGGAPAPGQYRPVSYTPPPAYHGYPPYVPQGNPGFNFAR